MTDTAGHLRTAAAHHKVALTPWAWITVMDLTAIAAHALNRAAGPGTAVALAACLGTAGWGIKRMRGRKHGRRQAFVLWAAGSAWVILAARISPFAAYGFMQTALILGTLGLSAHWRYRSSHPAARGSRPAAPEHPEPAIPAVPATPARPYDTPLITPAGQRTERTSTSCRPPLSLPPGPPRRPGPPPPTRPRKPSQTSSPSSTLTPR